MKKIKSTNPIIGTGLKTLSKIKDGDNGSSSAILELSNDSHVIPYEENGSTGNYNGCETIANFYIGNMLETSISKVSYRVEAQSDVEGTWLPVERKYVVNKLKSNSSYVDIIATYARVEYRARFTVSKVFNGKDSYLVDLTNDSHMFAASSTNELPSDIVVKTDVLVYKGISQINPVNISLPSTKPPGLDWSIKGSEITFVAKKGKDLDSGGEVEISVQVTQEKSLKKYFRWLKIRDGATLYTWVMYADDEYGNGISNFPYDKKYVGFSYNNVTEVESYNPEDYTWSKIEGDQGIPGIPGDDGVSLYTWIKYADTPTSGMSDNPDGKAYIGLAYNKEEQKESTNYSDYAWSKVKGEQGPQGVPGTPTYTWVKYADDMLGTNMSETPGNREYMGLAYNKSTPIESSDYKDYTWSKYRGSDGIAGQPGSDGKTYYTWIKYADTPTSGMSDNPDGKEYMGIAYNKPVSTESTNYADYQWSLVKGEDGIDGATYYTWIKYADTSSGSGMSDNPVGKEYVGIAYNKESQEESWDARDYVWSQFKGDQGIAGTPGADGETFYTWVKYANDANGSGMSDSPAGKTYLGLSYNQKNQTEGTDPKAYTWTKIVGDQGIPGAPGDDGVTYYTWLKYADTPTSGMSDDPKNKKYMGLAYNKTTQTESTNYSDYDWSLIKGDQGEQGVPGQNGVGVTKVTEYYLASSSSSGVTTSTPGWTESVQTTTTSKKYLWNYEKITFTNGSTQNLTPVVIGTHGATGDTGNGISGITEFYLASNVSSGITINDPGWSQTMQTTTTSKRYLWNYERINYTNGSTINTAPIIIGTHGATGEQGPVGPVGPTGPVGPAGPLLDWVQDWDGAKVSIGGTTVLSPKIFAGTVSNGKPTGVALGQNVFGTLNGYSGVNGIAGYKNGVKTYHLTVDGNFLVGNENANHMKFDGSKFVVRADSISIGSNSVATDTSVNDKIEAIQLGVRNLVKNSAPTTTGWGQYVDPSTLTVSQRIIDEPSAIDKKAMEISIGGSGSGSAGVHIVPSIRIEPGRKCSWSVWVKASRSMTATLGFEAGCIKDCAITTTWQQFTHTGTANDNRYWAFLVRGRYDTKSGDKIYFHSAMMVEGDKVPTWTPAPEDIDSSIKGVKDQADAAMEKHNELASDGKLTPSEKLVTKKDWEIIVGEKDKIVSEGNKFSVSTTAYVNNYNSLNSYLSPLLSNLTTTSTIVGATFRGNFANYYNARQDLLNSISSKAKALSENAQNTANTANGTANSNKTEITTTKSQVANIKTDLSSVTARVGTTEEKTTTLEKLTEKQLVNNFSRSGNLERWSGPNATLKSSSFVGNYMDMRTQGNDMNISDYFEIDPNKTYKFSMMVQTPSANGSWYFGFHAYDKDKNNVGVYPMQNTTLNTNCYFQNAKVTTAKSEWVTYEGYIYAHNTKVDANTPKGNSHTYYRFDPKVKYIRVRVLNFRADQYGDGTVGSVYFAHPSIATVDNQIVNTETRLKGAEQKITDEAITNTVKNNFYTKGDVDGKGYQNASQVQQTVDKFQLKFEESGGYNLLRNSKWLSGNSSFWSKGCHSGSGTYNEVYTSKRIEFKTYGNAKQGTMSHSMPVIAGKKYIFYMRVSYHRANGGRGVEFMFWDRENNTYNTSPNISKIGVTPANNGTFYDFTYAFTAPAGATHMQVYLWSSYGGDASAQYPYCHTFIEDAYVISGNIKTPWSPHPSEVYDGITTIDKDGITVMASNVKSKTNMSANGFKITKTDTNEDVFKVNSDGTLALKGSMTITSGSISDSAISSTIRNGASDGASAKSTITAKAPGWDSTKSTVDSNASKWNTTSTDVSNNKVNWGNAYNRVNDWAYGAVSGKTTIDGGLLQTNTIMADKIAIGDFTNYCEANHTNCSNYGLRVINSNNDPWMELIDLKRDTPLCSSKNYAMFKGNVKGTYRIEFEMSSTARGATSNGGSTQAYVPVGIGLYCKRKDGADAWYVVQGSSDSSGTVKTVSSTVTLDNTIASFGVYLQLNGWPPFSNTARIRNIRVNKMSTGELIVDGSITADKIHANGITADKIKGGTISASVKLQSDSIIMANGGIYSKGDFRGTGYGASLYSEVAKGQGHTYVRSKNNGIKLRCASDEEVHCGVEGSETLYSNLRAKRVIASEDVYATTDVTANRNLIVNGQSTLKNHLTLNYNNGLINFTTGYGIVRVSTSGQPLYLQTNNEIKCCTVNSSTTTIPIRAKEFRREDGKTAYINGTGNGTLTSYTLESAGVKSIATDMYLGVDGEVRATDKKGYNGGTITYKGIRGYNVMAQNKLYQGGQGVSYYKEMFSENVSSIVLGANVRRDSEGGLGTSFYTHSIFEYEAMDNNSLDIGTQISLLVKTIQEQNAIIENLRERVEALEK